MRIRQPRPRVMMSKTLAETEPESIDTFPPIVKEYWHCEYRVYVHEAMIATGWKMPLEEAMVAGKARFEAARATGEQLWLSSPNPVKPLSEQDHPPVVYYMRQSDLVKIGTTVKIRQRYDAIQPQGIMAVEYGWYELERKRHKQFVDQYSHGEWFRLEPPLVDHIIALRESFRGPNGEPVDQWLAPRLPGYKRREGRPAWSMPGRVVAGPPRSRI